MYQGNRDRSFSDGRGDPLDVAGSHVADGEYPRAGWFRADAGCVAGANARPEVVALTGRAPVLHGSPASSQRDLTARSQAVLRRGAGDDEQGRRRDGACAQRRAARSSTATGTPARGARGLRARPTWVCVPQRDAAGSALDPVEPGSATSAVGEVRPPRIERRARRRAVWARNTAAWPAELPPPTTMTSSRRDAGNLRGAERWKHVVGRKPDGRRRRQHVGHATSVLVHDFLLESRDAHRHHEFQEPSGCRCGRRPRSVRHEYIHQRARASEPDRHRLRARRRGRVALPQDGSMAGRQSF